MTDTTEPTTAGDAYDAVLIGALRDRVFSFEDYDAEAAAREAASEIPQLSPFAWRWLADNDNAGEETQP